MFSINTFCNIPINWVNWHPGNQYLAGSLPNSAMNRQLFVITEESDDDIKIEPTSDDVVSDGGREESSGGALVSDDVEEPAGNMESLRPLLFNFADRARELRSHHGSDDSDVDALELLSFSQDEKAEEPHNFGVHDAQGESDGQEDDPYSHDAYIKELNRRDGFEFHAKFAGLTYSQVPPEWRPRDVIEWLEERFDCVGVTVGVEKHKDGGIHYHVLVEFTKKTHIRSSAAFDLFELHPNIKFLKDKKGVTRWRSYSLKFGIFETSQRLDMSTSHNYIKRKNDFETWIRDGSDALKDEWNEERCWIFGCLLSWPQKNMKRRHLWIYGAPDAGKTTEVRRALGDCRAFVRRNKPYFYEGYRGENLIIVDDQDEDNPLTKSELTWMTNGCWGSNPTPVYGATRYSCTFLKKDTTIHYIVVANSAPPEEPWLRSRFNWMEIVDWNDTDESQRAWVVQCTGPIFGHAE